MLTTRYCDSRTTAKIDWLGWEVKVASGTIGVSREIVYGVLCGFVDVNTEVNIQIKCL